MRTAAVLVLLVPMACGSTVAGPPDNARTAALEARTVELEARIAQLERRLDNPAEPVPSTLPTGLTLPIPAVGTLAQATLKQAQPVAVRLELVVTEDGSELDSEAVSDEQLTKRMQRAGRSADTSVRIRIADSVSYERTIAVLDILNKAGITHIALISRARPEATP